MKSYNEFSKMFESISNTPTLFKDFNKYIRILYKGESLYISLNEKGNITYNKSNSSGYELDDSDIKTLVRFGVSDVEVSNLLLVSNFLENVLKNYGFYDGDKGIPYMFTITGDGSLITLMARTRKQSIGTTFVGVKDNSVLRIEIDARKIKL